MCGIVGSFDLATIKIGYEAIASRGTRYKSISAIRPEDGVVIASLVLQPDEDLSTLFLLEKYKGSYFVLHAASPTGTTFHPHPAGPVRDNKKLWLWHNGMLNSTKYRTTKDADWDTALLREEIVDKGLKLAAEEFEGSFACVLSGATLGFGSIVVFRNRIAPMFIHGTSIASVKLSKDYEMLPAGEFIGIFSTPIRTGVFENSYNPFGV